MSTTEVARDGSKVSTIERKPFWGLVNGKPLRIRRIGCTGEFASGKSLFIDRIDTRNTFKIDLEASSDTFNLPFKKYVCLYDEVKTVNSSGIPTAIECFLWFDDMLEKVKTGEYTVVAVDPINEIQSGCYDWVYSNPGKFGRTQGQYDKMTAMVWGDVKTYLDMRIGMLTNKIETFAYTVHMGQVWKDGKPVEGKMKAKGSDVFRKMADVFFVLSRPVDPKTGRQPDKPIGIIAPPIGKCRLVHANPDDCDEAYPILPPVIKDLTANAIRRYILKPPDYKNLAPDQLVPHYELTDDDKLQMQVRIAEAQEESERLRNERLANVADAAARNKAAKEKGVKAAQELAEKEPETGLPLVANPVFPPDIGQIVAVRAEVNEEPPFKKDLPSVKDAVQPASKAVAGTADDIRATILEQGRDLWGDQVKAGLVKAIEKRGGPGTKLADLTPDQLVELTGALWNALTKRDMANTPEGE